VIIGAALVWGCSDDPDQGERERDLALGSRHHRATAPGEAAVASLEVQAGADEEAGQVIARFDQPALKEQIESTQSRLDGLVSPTPALSQRCRAGIASAFEGDLKRMRRQLEENSRVVSNMDGRWSSCARAWAARSPPAPHRRTEESGAGRAWRRFCTSILTRASS
jgi:hypothetical protein